MKREEGEFDEMQREENEIRWNEKENLMRSDENRIKRIR